MLEAFLPLLLILAAFYILQSALKAREQARAFSQRLCGDARVQLLDQTVSLTRLGFARGADGRLHLRRRYRFELSTDGLDRHHGTLEILDGELVAHSLALPLDTPPIEAVSNVIPLPPPGSLRRH